MDGTAPLEPLEPLEPPCEWRSEALADSYVVELSPAHLDELDEALRYAEAHTADVLEITAAHFPLPTLGADLERITEDLINGRGVVLLRGLPVESTVAAERQGAPPRRRDRSGQGL